jgi:hypothetical protein
MVLDPSGGLYLTMSGAGFSSFPGSLLGVIAYIRQVWIDADHYRLAKELYAKSPASIARPDYDRALEGVLAVRRVLLPANSLVQVERMLRFGKELGTPVVLYGGHEGYRAAEPLKKAGVPVILNVKWPARARDGDPEAEDPLRTLELRDKAPTTPAALAAAGVKFAVCSDGQDTPRDVLRSLKNSIDVGLKADDALRALTLSAAEIYGAANRLGSIEKGKIANLTVVKGDLFDNRSQVKMVFIDGVKYEPAPEAPAGPPSAGPPTRPSTPQEVIQ